MGNSQRVGFIVDGFNVYHSLADSQKVNNGVCSKWFDIDGFCRAYLVPIGLKLNVTASLEEIHYFSALATHLLGKDPEKIIRHKAYIQCLEHTGIKVHLGRFKKKAVKYRNKKVSVCIETHEEKETDVAIAIKAFELFHTDSIDILVIVSGDSDMVPAVRAVKKNFPTKKVISVFPAGRKSDDMSSIVDASFKASSGKYKDHQLDNPYHLDNMQIAKPDSW